MVEPKDRLQEARRDAGFDKPRDAAKAYGWNINTYHSHENGHRNISKEGAIKYSRRFRVNLEWLLTGRGVKRNGPAPTQDSMDTRERLQTDLKLHAIASATVDSLIEKHGSSIPLEHRNQLIAEETVRIRDLFDKNLVTLD